MPYTVFAENPSSIASRSDGENKHSLRNIASAEADPAIGEISSVSIRAPDGYFR